ncbi:MAG: rubrerythrin [Dehalococcoidia bacterium]|nr:MAG: rubrerythrin [Dehalococcoidia bacterium]
MADELGELFDVAIYREIASQALYHAAREKTDDAGAKVLLEELEKGELKHERQLKALREKGFRRTPVRRESVADLKMSDYLQAPMTIEGAGLQDTLTFAIIHEQQAVDFYTGLMAILESPEAQSVCQSLMQSELSHKAKLERLFDDLFYKED